jgi:hypothetical protein
MLLGIVGLGGLVVLGGCGKRGDDGGRAGGGERRVAGEVDFNRDVRPILADRCFSCHGPDSANGREGGLRLDTFEGAAAVLESGKRAIVPGNPEASELVARLEHADPDERMPPKKLNRPLAEEEIATLVEWVGQGAKYQPHWGFSAPQRHPAPAVSDPGWCRDPLDRFVLAKLEANGMAPNPAADRATLLRRVSFTLTGLPPTPEQTAAFEADQSPDAYEKQVDALLASPRFGERLAQDWLDVARYADTYGYQSDNECFVWPWRDWVIRAFNTNLPYDQFASWQLAGDLLPEPTVDQRLATAFNRLHRQTQEGGSIAEEFRHEYVADRVHTFGTAFLGLTLECARCHDHKYDPIPQRDYYRMAAMFGQVDESGLFPYSLTTSAPPPSMRLMEPAQEKEAAARRGAMDAAGRAHRELIATRTPAFKEWLKSAGSVVVPAPAARYPLDSAAGQKSANLVADGSPASITGGQLKAVPGAAGEALEFDGDTVLQLDGVPGTTRHEPLSIVLGIFSPEPKERAVILHSGPALFSQAADASGFELLLENGKLRWSCIHLWPGCAASIETTDPFPVGQWVQVAVTYDGSSRADGLKIFLNGAPATTTVVRDHLDKQISTDLIRVGARPRDDRGFAGGRLDELAVFRTQLSAAEVAASAGIPTDSTLAAARSGDPAASDQLRDHFLTRVDPAVAASRAALTAARKHLEDDFLARLPLIMCMEESKYPRTFHVLTRGDYSAPDLSQPVTPAPPTAIMPFSPQAPRNRLGLAQWLTDPQNPLTARVAVNRFWMLCFANGIVPTQENFGLQGDSPTHQELLDTLARDFVDSHWNVKQLLKRIVMSATYQQASASTPAKRERDPNNALLSRGPASRLSAEAIRDQALLAAGLLVEKVGGPSVKPWQPPGIWSEAGAAGGDYQPDQGDGRYRRSLYTYRKRTAPPPNMLTLDAGSREICQARRLTTNTPLQPLVFLNDASFFECAQRLAKRATAAHPGEPSARLTFAFQQLASRRPRAAEAAAIDELYAAQQRNFANDPAAATAVCGENNPELAALTIVCSTLLTADATLTSR